MRTSGLSYLTCAFILKPYINKVLFGSANIKNLRWMENGSLSVAFGATVFESAHNNKGSIFISNKTVTVSVLSLVPALLA